MTTKLYKYTVTVFDTSPHSGNMILDSIGGGDPLPADYDMEECNESELIRYGATILGRKIVSVEYAKSVKERDAAMKEAERIANDIKNGDE